MRGRSPGGGRWEQLARGGHRLTVRRAVDGRSGWSDLAGRMAVGVGPDRLESHAARPRPLAGPPSTAGLDRPAAAPPPLAWSEEGRRLRAMVRSAAAHRAVRRRALVVRATGSPPRSTRWPARSSVALSAGWIGEAAAAMSVLRVDPAGLLSVAGAIRALRGRAEPRPGRSAAWPRRPPTRCAGCSWRLSPGGWPRCWTGWTRWPGWSRSSPTASPAPRRGRRPVRRDRVPAAGRLGLAGGRARSTGSAGAAGRALPLLDGVARAGRAGRRPAADRARVGGRPAGRAAALGRAGHAGPAEARDLLLGLPAADRRRLALLHPALVSGLASAPVEDRFAATRVLVSAESAGCAGGWPALTGAGPGRGRTPTAVVRRAAHRQGRPDPAGRHPAGPAAPAAGVRPAR